MARKTRIITFIAGLTLVGMLFSCPLAIGRTSKHRTHKKRQTTMVTQPNKTIPLNTQDTTLTIALGDTLKFTYTSFRSTGEDYWFEFDSEAFDLKSRIEYLNPMYGMEPGMCGTDEAEETCTFTSLKKGKFTITIKHCETGGPPEILSVDVTVK